MTNEDEPSEEAKRFAADPRAWVNESLMTLANLPPNLRPLELVRLSPDLMGDIPFVVKTED
jgi:hypothetical protein